MLKSKSELYEVFLVLVAICFVTCFSYTTSPLYSTLGDSPDSSIFQIIGKYWAQGLVPYKDLWDLKGPYIFFVNAVGYGITNNRNGVWILQILFLSATLIITYRTFLQCYTRWNAVGLTIFSLAGLSYTYQGGNLTEEYLLPFLALAFYFIIKWGHQYHKKSIVTHHPCYSIVYGMVLGLSLMSRLTNALPICGAVIVISCILLKHTEFRNFYHNAIAFISGVFVTTVPFLIYFYSKQALPEMWNGTFLYAVRYAASSSNDIMSYGIHYFILSYFNSILLLSLTLWMILKEKKVTTFSWLWLLTAGFPFVWFCQSNGYGHYGTIVYPLFTISMLIIHKMHLTYLHFVVIIILLIGCTSKVRYLFTMYNNQQDKNIAKYKTFLQQNPMIDFSSFVIYNCHPNIYLEMNIRPANPIFSIQDMGVKRIPEWRMSLFNTYKAYQPKWIIVDVEDYHTPGIQRILSDDYVLKKWDKRNNLKLYNLRKGQKSKR